jgi:hypothetical protein
MESFFSSLKIEQAANKVYRTRDDAKADVLDYPEPRMSREALRLLAESDATVFRQFLPEPWSFG